MSRIKKSLEPFRLPRTRLELDESLKASSLLTNLWDRKTHFDRSKDELNAPKTLPEELKTRGEVNREVSGEFPNKKGFPLKLKQLTTYGKMIVSFYKNGVKNVWYSKKEARLLMNQNFKLTNVLNSSGKEEDIRIPSFKKLTFEMAQALSINKVEMQAYNDQTRGDVVKPEKEEAIYDFNLFNLSRRQFQIINRTREDFVKLPIFALIFMIFFECTPILCYLMPEITPSTCVLPQIMPRIWSSGPQKKLREIENKNIDWIDRASQTAFNIPKKELYLLARSLRLTSKYFPIFLYPEGYVRDLLQGYRNYLKVDNYFLSGLNRNGNVWDLSNQELLRAALERNLIPDLKRDAEKFNEIDDLAEQHVKEKAYFNKLRLRLIEFIINFESYDVGYLAAILPDDRASDTLKIL